MQDHLCLCNAFLCARSRVFDFGANQTKVNGSDKSDKHKSVLSVIGDMDQKVRFVLGFILPKF